MEIYKVLIQLINNISLEGWLTIIAIFTSPITTLRIQNKLGKREKLEQRRVDTFATLMETRASGLFPEHIRALNKIDTLFYGSKYSQVTEAWRAYLCVRNQFAPTTEAELVQFNKSCEETLVNLLLAMGRTLGYEFDSTHIKQSIYKPQGHITEEAYQIFVKTKLVELLSGKLSLPVDIKSVPSLQDGETSKRENIKHTISTHSTETEKNRNL